MRFSRFLLPLFAVLMLSACAGTVQNDPANHGEFSNWMNGHPSKIEQSTWRMPTGYSGQNVNKPLRAITNSEGNVTTFVEETTTTETVITEPPAELIGDATMLPPPSAGYGTLAQQLYFRHGSAHLTPAEKGSIRSLANSITSATTVTVLGHASHRVDGTSDPVRANEINFTMAQKRADAVTRVLNSSGANPAMVQSISRGDEDASGNEETDRRVDIYTSEGAPAIPLTN